MRTLKKTLALVLVLAMMFSLCAVSASADFTDADEITYAEAADVMAAIGVIEGMPDGSFDAKGTLTRAQAATIITRLLGAEDYAIATAGEFEDVAADHWAAGAISFCVDAGIVAGYGDGKFGPSDTLTGYQWAKMLLCALGYNAQSEGMTGAAWQIAVAKLAKNNGVFAGNDKADKTVGVTREEAALYAFNLLDAYTVEYKGGTSFTVAGITFTQGGTMIQGTKEYPTTDTFKAAYFPLLKASAMTEDAYGHPAHGWYFGKVENKDTFIGLYVDEAAMSYTTGVPAPVLAKTLKGYTFTETVAEAYDTVDEIAAATGNGILVELFINHLNQIYAVTVEPAFSVTRVVDVKDTAATKTRGAYTTYTFADASAGKIFTTVVNEEKDEDTIVLHDEIAKGDYVLKNTVAGTANYYAVETVTGKITSIDSKGVVTLGGEAYEVSAYYDIANLAVDSKKPVTVILDNYGYIIGKTTSDTPDDVYGMVLNTTESVALVDGKLDYTYTANVAYTDGTVAALQTAVDYADDMNGEIVKVVINPKTGLASFEKAAATAELGEIKAKNGVLAEGLYGGNKTIFVFANYVWSEKAEAYVVDGTVTTVTGVANVGNYVAPENEAFEALDVAVAGKTDGLADVVYVYENVQATSVANYVYALGASVDYGTYVANSAIVKGEEATVETIDGALTAGVLYKAVVDGSAVEFDAEADAALMLNGALSNYAGYIKVGEAAPMSDVKVSADAVIYAINESYLAQGDVTVATYKFADLTTAMPAGEIYLAKDASGAVAAIYLVYTIAD